MYIHTCICLYLCAEIQYVYIYIWMERDIPVYMWDYICKLCVCMYACLCTHLHVYMPIQNIYVCCMRFMHACVCMHVSAHNNISHETFGAPRPKSLLTKISKSAGDMAARAHKSSLIRSPRGYGFSLSKFLDIYMYIHMCL